MSKIKEHRTLTARLRSNVLRGCGNDEVLRSAWIVMSLKTMAVMVRKALKTQLTIYTMILSFHIPYSWARSAAIRQSRKYFP